MNSLIGKHNTRPDQRREKHDWYVDPLWCSKALFKAYKFRAGIIYDPCCGKGSILKSALEAEYITSGSDIEDRGWHTHSDSIRDFLDARDDLKRPLLTCVIAMNPPYSFAVGFINRALEFSDEVAVLLPATFLYSEKRHPFFVGAGRWPLIKIIHLSTRPTMPPGHLIGKVKPTGGKTDYCWLVFDKTQPAKTPETEWVLR